MKGKVSKTVRKLLYLYCVTKVKPPPGDYKETGVKISTIYFEGIYAIAGRVSSDEFSEKNLKKNLANMEWVENKVRRHEKVVEKVMKESTIIPFKFGTIFQTEENVLKLLNEKNKEFKSVMADLEGKEEWGLKIYCESDKLKGTIKEEEDELRQIEKDIISAGAGRAYFLKKKKDEFINDIVSRRISGYTRDSFERFKKITLKAKVNKVLPKEVTEREEEMVLNAAFLVRKKRIESLNNAVKNLREKYADKGLGFDLTGPWPPYNFCGKGQ